MVYHTVLALVAQKWVFQSLEGPGPVKGFVFKRWIGWSLRLMSLKMAVLGCHSGNALRRFAKSSANKCATRSFAIKSRNAQGIYVNYYFIVRIRKNVASKWGARTS